MSLGNDRLFVNYYSSSVASPNISNLSQLFRGKVPILLILYKLFCQLIISFCAPTSPINTSPIRFLYSIENSFHNLKKNFSFKILCFSIIFGPDTEVTTSDN